MLFFSWFIILSVVNPMHFSSNAAGVSPSLRARWSHDKPSESPLLQRHEPSNLRDFSRIRRVFVSSHQPQQVLFYQQFEPWNIPAAQKPESGMRSQPGGVSPMEPTQEQPWTGKPPKAVTFHQSSNTTGVEAIVKERPSPAGSSRCVESEQCMDTSVGIKHACILRANSFLSFLLSKYKRKESE